MLLSDADDVLTAAESLGAALADANAGARMIHWSRPAGPFLFVAGVIPLAALGGEFFFPFRINPVPVSIGVSSVVVLWALFRHQLFDITPIARDAILSEGISAAHRTQVECVRPERVGQERRQRFPVVCLERIVAERTGIIEMRELE